MFPVQVVENACITELHKAKIVFTVHSSKDFCVQKTKLFTTSYGQPNISAN